MKKKILYLFSAGFPFGKGEVFLANELAVLSTQFDTIKIFPSKKEGIPRSIPKNCEIFSVKAKDSTRSVLFENFKLISEIILNELWHTGSKVYFLKNLKTHIGNLIVAFKNAKEISSIIIDDEDNYFYSYWMNNWALTCSILKQKECINHFVFRVHGFDLYNYNRPGNYIPFRYFNMKNANFIFTVSMEGREYLKTMNIFPQKVKCSYLGVFDNGVNPFKKEIPITIVTCSSFNINKRILLWIEVLKKVKCEIKWIHFGDGGDLKKEHIMEASSCLPANIVVEFKGSVANEELLEFYSITPVHLFVNVSSTEGLPVTLMEASSFGIPMMATNVGGVAEIVNDKTGYLLEKDFDLNYASSLIDSFYNSKKNTIEFRQQVREMWVQNFNAEINYIEFYKTLING